MSNYCAQLPPHTGLYIHGWPQIQKSPHGYTQGPKFIVFQNARIQTIFEDVKKTYFKFNQITMRPSYNGEELFFEQNKRFLKNLQFLRQKIVIKFPNNWVFQKIMDVPKFYSKINGELSHYSRIHYSRKLHYSRQFAVDRGFLFNKNPK